MNLCSCGSEAVPGQRECLACHRAYMAMWRAANPGRMSAESRRRASTRAKTKVYEKRGKLTKQVCARCGSNEQIERHHPDYSDPMMVVYLCRPCHLDLHRPWRHRKRESEAT